LDPPGTPKLTRERILKSLQDELPFLYSRYGVKNIALYGSYAHETADDQSDIDLVVHLENPLGLDFFGIAAYLEEKFGRSVDLITYESLQRCTDHPRRARIAADIKKSLLYV
jgi:uncharacterized protein